MSQYHESDELMKRLWCDLWAYDDETEHFNISANLVQLIGLRLIAIDAITAAELSAMLAGMNATKL